MTALVRVPSAVRWPAPLATCFAVSIAALNCRPFSYDHVVIGAGVVGLAVAGKLAEYPRPNT
jgi:hypothetical protein